MKTYIVQLTLLLINLLLWYCYWCHLVKVLHTTEASSDHVKLSPPPFAVLSQFSNGTMQRNTSFCLLFSLGACENSPSTSLLPLVVSLAFFFSLFIYYLKEGYKDIVIWICVSFICTSTSAQVFSQTTIALSTTSSIPSKLTKEMNAMNSQMTIFY